MKLLGMFSGRHKPDVESLSALADGRLASGDAAALRNHLTSCEACRTRLDELRQVRSALTLLPRPDAPRSFRLRPSDVQEQAPARAAGSAAGAMRAVPALAGVAAVLLVAIIAVDAASHGGGAGTGSDSYQAAARDNDMQAESGIMGDSPGPTGLPQGDAAGEKTADDAEAGAAAPQPRAPEVATGFSTFQTSPTPAPVLRAQPTQAPASPEAARASDQVSDDGDDSQMGWRIAEAALGAIAAGAAGIAIFNWRARQR